MSYSTVIKDAVKAIAGSNQNHKEQLSQLDGLQYRLRKGTDERFTEDDMYYVERFSRTLKGLING